MNQRKKRCEICGSTQIYIRISSGEMVCYHCGHINGKNKEKEFKKRLEGED